MMRAKPILILLAYAAATIGYVWFHFAYINSNRLFHSNDIVAYLVSFVVLFSLPLVGLIHVSRLILNGAEFRQVAKRAALVGLLGPVVLTLLIKSSGDGEAAMGYVLLPVAYIVFVLAAYVCLLGYHCFVPRPA